VNQKRLLMNDDHGDRFPGALPAPDSAPRGQGTDERIVRMHAAYVRKANAVVEAGRDGLADELATTFAEEVSAARRTTSPSRRAGAGSGTPARGRTGGPTSRSATPGGGVRALIRRLDRYTLEVFNAGTPTRPLD